MLPTEFKSTRVPSKQEAEIGKSNTSYEPDANKTSAKYI